MSMVDRGLPLCVGRETELERLEEALATTAESRSGLMLLTGDAGCVERSSQAS
jgi:predicted ATPase